MGPFQGTGGMRQMDLIFSESKIGKIESGVSSSTYTYHIFYQVERVLYSSLFRILIRYLSMIFKRTSPSIVEKSFAENKCTIKEFYFEEMQVRKDKQRYSYEMSFFGHCFVALSF